jgi:hypothetical protein
VTGGVRARARDRSGNRIPGGAQIGRAACERGGWRRGETRWQNAAAGRPVRCGGGAAGRWRQPELGFGGCRGGQQLDGHRGGWGRQWEAARQCGGGAAGAAGGATGAEEEEKAEPRRSGGGGGESVRRRQPVAEEETGRREVEEDAWRRAGGVARSIARYPDPIE